MFGTDTVFFLSILNSWMVESMNMEPPRADCIHSSLRSKLGVGAMQTCMQCVDEFIKTEASC